MSNELLKPPKDASENGWRASKFVFRLLVCDIKWVKPTNNKLPAAVIMEFSVSNDEESIDKQIKVSLLSQYDHEVSKYRVVGFEVL